MSENENVTIQYYIDGQCEEMHFESRKIPVSKLYEKLSNPNLSLKTAGKGSTKIKRYWNTWNAQASEVSLRVVKDPQITTTVEFKASTQTKETFKAALRTHIFFNNIVRCVASYMRKHMFNDGDKKLTNKKARADANKLFSEMSGGIPFKLYTGLNNLNEFNYSVIEEARRIVSSTKELKKLYHKRREVRKNELQKLYGQLFNSNEWSALIQLENDYTKSNNFLLYGNHLRGWKTIRNKWLKLKNPTTSELLAIVEAYRIKSPAKFGDMEVFKLLAEQKNWFLWNSDANESADYPTQRAQHNRLNRRMRGAGFTLPNALQHPCWVSFSGGNPRSTTNTISSKSFIPNEKVTLRLIGKKNQFEKIPVKLCGSNRIKEDQFRLLNHKTSSLHYGAVKMVFKRSDLDKVWKLLPADMKSVVNPASLKDACDWNKINKLVNWIADRYDMCIYFKAVFHINQDNYSFDESLLKRAPLKDGKEFINIGIKDTACVINRKILGIDLGIAKAFAYAIVSYDNFFNAKIISTSYCKSLDGLFFDKKPLTKHDEFLIKNIIDNAFEAARWWSIFCKKYDANVGQYPYNSDIAYHLQKIFESNIQKLKEILDHTSGNSMLRIQWYCNYERLYRKWHQRQRIVDGKVKPGPTKILGSKRFLRLNGFIYRLKDDRCKKIAAQIIKTALNNQVSIISVEDLRRYKFKDSRPKYENSMLMRWCHGKIITYLERSAKTYGLHVIRTPASYSSKFLAMNGAPGIRCTENLKPSPVGKQFISIQNGHIMHCDANINAAINIAIRIVNNRPNYVRVQKIDNNVYLGISGPYKDCKFVLNSDEFGGYSYSCNASQESNNIEDNNIEDEEEIILPKKETEKLFTDFSGKLFKTGRWYIAKDFWERTHTQIDAAVQKKT